MTHTQATMVIWFLFMLLVMLWWACVLLERIHKTLKEIRFMRGEDGVAR